MIPRLLLNTISKAVKPGRVWLLLGARRVGKTVLVKEHIQRSKSRWLEGHGEDAAMADLLESRSAERIRQVFAGYEGFFLDEAQSVPRVGQALKLIVDTLPELKVIATGSSSFRLDQLMGQPLTGRRTVAHLHPVAATELAEWKGPLAPNGLLEDLLLYGSYPEVMTISTPAARRDYLRQLVEDYLFQDILAFEQLRNPRKLRDLTTLVAHQVGSELSLNELANALQINKATVERYLDLLEKNFVLFRVGGFSRNLRKEVTKSMRYYFVDCGIRNAIIDQFQPLKLRPDLGALWESFVVNERKRKIEYTAMDRKAYFWRTYDQQEIDRVEVDTEGQMEGFECKWKEKAYKPPAAWSKAYPDSPIHLVHSKNFMTYLG
ncbi:MAG: ATP-binding protein [Puniceicoccaceae bacterium]